MWDPLGLFRPPGLGAYRAVKKRLLMTGAKGTPGTIPRSLIHALNVVSPISKPFPSVIPQRPTSACDPSYATLTVY